MNEAISFADRDDYVPIVDVFDVLDIEGQESLPDDWLDLDFAE